MWQFNMDRFSVMIELWQHMHEFTTDDLAEIAHVPRSTLYSIKKGDLAPSLAQFVSICNITEMPPETFFKKVKKNERE